MSARLIAITSPKPHSGKTHLTAALARWLSSHGHSVEILHLGAASPGRVAASDGALISRNAALLAEAAQVSSGARHEDPAALPSLAVAVEFLLIETAQAPPADVDLTLQLLDTEGSFKLDGFGKLPAWNAPPVVPRTPPDVAAMEAWRVGGWPRTGIVTLPHLANFSDFRIFRGAEWMTAPLPGRFGIIFIPSSTDPGSDSKWMEQQGLSAWLASQSGEGCRVLATGWRAPGAEIIEAEDLRDPASASRLVGRRLDPLLPDEETYDRLASWLASWTRFSALIQRIEALVVK
jgi:hypothetical protein